MNTLVLMACACLSFGAEPRPSVLVVVGAEGTPEYGREFRQWAVRWEEAARRGNADFARIGTGESGETTDRRLLEQRLSENAEASPEALWLILIGHGTFD